MRLAKAFLCLVLWTSSALAVEPGEALKDPALEARSRELSAELRCLVCQNQSIDDSQASLAKDLRLLVRERIAAGDSNDAVRAYLVARYGNFILLKPPLKTGTILLWATPFAVLLLGGLAIAFSARRFRGVAAPGSVELSAEERKKLDDLLDA
jgi:cytochrome c-type biogenesis protein CcmH